MEVRERRSEGVNVNQMPLHVLRSGNVHTRLHTCLHTLASDELWAGHSGPLSLQQNLPFRQKFSVKILGCPLLHMGEHTVAGLHHICCWWACAYRCAVHSRFLQKYIYSSCSGRKLQPAIGQQPPASHHHYIQAPAAKLSLTTYYWEWKEQLFFPDSY